jgi:hypothetical protein
MICGIPQDILQYSLPCAQITEFNYPGTANARSLNGHNIELLGLMPSLERCIIHATFDGDLEDDHEILLLPNLHRLRIKECNGHAIHQLLSFLTLPKLHNLMLNGVESGGRFADSVVTMIDRSKCSISDMRLSSPHISDSTCLRMLGAAPQATYLHLQAPKALTPHFFRSLRLNAGEIELVPLLRSLSLVTGSKQEAETHLRALKATRPGLKTTTKQLTK